MPTVSEEISHILLKKLREEELTPAEAAMLSEWEGRSPEHAAFIAKLMDEELLTEKIRGLLQLDEDVAWQRIGQRIAEEWDGEEQPPVKRIQWYKYGVAVSIVLLLGMAGIYFLRSKQPVSEVSKSTKPSTFADVVPGKNRAVLTLSNGAVIDLEEAKMGILAEEEGAKVVKDGDGRLTYEKTGAEVQLVSSMNKVETPRGGQYRIVLPDASVVYLNAASSIKYPTVFGDERRVEITGEVFFEVMKDPGRKFRAIINSGDGTRKAEIEVLGTQFNVNAYDEENVVAASLIEGSVKMAAGAGSKILKPGQQARLTNANALNLVNDADLDQVVAWKDGYTSFKEANVRTIMREISRWYNIDVVYEGNIDDKHTVNGATERTTSLETLIKVLQLTDVNCSIENGKLVVRSAKPRSH